MDSFGLKEWVGETLRRPYDDALTWVAANGSDDDAGSAIEADDDGPADGEVTEDA